jgi:hypothetical protein
MKLLNHVVLWMTLLFMGILLVSLPNTDSQFAKRDAAIQEMNAIREMDKLKEFTSEVIFQFAASHRGSLILLASAAAVLMFNSVVAAANLCALSKAGDLQAVPNRELRSVRDR